MEADRKSTIELFDKARVTRGGDVVAGDQIFVDQRSDFFSVSAGKDGASGGRVRAILQPIFWRTQPKAANVAFITLFMFGAGLHALALPAE